MRKNIDNEGRERERTSFCISPQKSIVNMAADLTKNHVTFEWMVMHSMVNLVRTHRTYVLFLAAFD